MKKLFCLVACFCSLNAHAAEKITDLQCVALKQIIDTAQCGSRIQPATYANDCYSIEASKQKAANLFDQNDCYRRVYQDIHKLIASEADSPKKEGKTKLK